MNTTSSSRLAEILEYLVDDHVGIIRFAREVSIEAGAPPFFHFYAEACDTRAFSRQKNFGDTGGVSANREIALAKAIGEAVERYCSALFEPTELPLCSFDEAPFPCVSPSEFALFNDAQYSSKDFLYVQFDNATKVKWTPALDLETGNVCYVPAAMVFAPYYYNRESGEQSIAQPISTGLACHVTPHQAAKSAICEVVERDAFTITWQACISPPRIRIETLNDTNRDLVERFERTGGIVTLLHLRMDHGIPVILSVLRNGSPDAPALVFAASADLCPEEAVRKSLEELAHTQRLAQFLKSERPLFTPGPRYENVDSQNDHVSLYCDAGNASLANFVFASRQFIDVDEIDNLATTDHCRDLEILVKEIRALGHRVLIADLTTPDVRDLGLTVVRAVIPGFHPLFMGHQIRPLGGSRLWEVPQDLGYPGVTRESGDNPAPHPFP